MLFYRMTKVTSSFSVRIIVFTDSPIAITLLVLRFHKTSTTYAQPYLDIFGSSIFIHVMDKVSKENINYICTMSV